MSEKVLSKEALEDIDTPVNGSTESAAGGGNRRKRYERLSTPSGLPALTPVKVQMLRYLAEMRFLSLPQLARLCCPAEREDGAREDLSRKSARKHLRALFDAGLVSVLPVSRLALAPPSAANDASLLYGSASNVYAPTTEALQLLLRAGLVEREWAKRPPVVYGPKNSLFLAHELQVRDVRVWLEKCAAASGGEQKLLTWKDGQDAVIKLGEAAPFQVRPDAWFVYQVRPAHSGNKPTVLAALVEVDRATERGDRHWAEKRTAYDALFAGDFLQTVTGYMNARVLIFTPNTRRRDSLAQFIKNQGGLAITKFWLVDCNELLRLTVHDDSWRKADSSALNPLLQLWTS